MKISVTGASITITEPEVIAAGSVNIYKAEFTFDAAWDGLTKVAFFLFRDELHPAVLDEENKCTIPWEAIQTDGWLQIACGGYLGVSKVLTSHYTEPQRIGEGADYESFKPEPSALAEVLMYMAASAESAAQAAQSAEDARHQPIVGENGNWYTWDGENYVDTGDRAQGPQGEKGDTGNGIVSVDRTSGTGAPGTTDTYTITYTSGGTATFTVTHGTDGAATSKLTGYSKALTSEQLAATDTVLQAFGKLEKRIDDNASQISQLANVTVPAYIKSLSPVFGVLWDKGETPTMTRINDAVGMVANVGIDSQLVRNDFDDAPILGQFETVEDSAGNVFRRIPKTYIKKVDGTVYRQVQYCPAPRDGFYLPKCFISPTGQELDYVDIGKYIGSLDSTKLASKADTFPLTNKNIVEMRGYAQANGAGYQQMDIHTHDLISALFDVEFATLNSQAIMRGFVDGQYSESHVATATEAAATRIVVANATAALYRVGQSIGIGTTLGGGQIAQDRVITAIDTLDESNKYIAFDGAAVDVTTGNILYNMGWKNGFSSVIAASSGVLTANDGKYPMVWRGIENLYGNVFQFVDGVNITDRQAWVCEDPTQYASNVFASPYKKLSYVNGSTNGYAVAMGYDPLNPYAQLPVSITGGDAAKYYCDYYYQDAGARIALFGGYWNYGSDAGLRYWVLSRSSSRVFLYLSARLVRKAV